MMTQEELWTLVGIVLDHKGKDAPEFVISKIQSFMKDQDYENAAVWRVVATKINRVLLGEIIWQFDQARRHAAAESG